MRSLAICTVLLTAVASMAAIIQPAAVISQEYNFNSVLDAINNDGMDTAVNGGDTLASALAATHAFHGGYDASYVSTDPGLAGSDFFASLGGDTDVDLVLDLSGGGDVSFGSIILWQYENNGGGGANVGNGLSALEVRINTEAQGSMTFGGPATSITLLPVVDGDADPLNDLGGINSAQMFSLGAQSGRYALLSLTDNYFGLQGMTGGGDRVGLGEVRFDSTVIPEPSALALLGLGITFLAVRRRFR